jgi:hypothetical protein
VAAALVLLVLAGCATQPTPSPQPPVGSGSRPVEDPTLLAILPASVSGAAVNREPGSFADALNDPTFVADVDTAAFAVVVDGSDLASGMVARLRPGVFSDSFYREWRDSYGLGACKSYEGVAGNAQAPLGGQTVYITSCNGDLRVYHTWLDGRGVLITLFSTGLRRFGEQLMTGLRP